MKKKYLVLLIIIISFGGCKSNVEINDKVSNFRFEEITISEIQDLFTSGELTIPELTQAYIDRINAIDKNGILLNSIIVINPDALQIAQQLQKEFDEGKTRGPLHGIPVVLKDNIDTHDKMPTTAGSRALKESFPLQDSYVAKQLREAGAIILAKANLSEWANFRGELSSSGWSGINGQTKNPYYLDRNPCGSSSGSGVAVSANLTVLAIGTETNGSIVCPSSANGIVGIKPTVGLISRSGIIPISFTQDTPGPMARTVEDAAVCLGALVGIDEKDSKTLKSDGNYYTDYTQFLDPNGLQGKRIALYTGAMGTHYKVDELTKQAIEVLKAQGAEVMEIDQVSATGVGRYSFEIMLYEYKDGLNEYFKSLGPEAKIKNLDELIAFNKNDSIELKYYNQEYLIMANEKGDLNSKEYIDALEKLAIGTQKEGIDKVMDEYNLDAIIAPTGSPAWKTDWVNGDHYLLGSSSPAAQSGYPNITVPMGDINGLPVGLSFYGRAWSEPVLIEITFAFEQATKYRIVPHFKEN